ncbi:MAG: PqqD family protein [Phycisphaerae bacterium]|nr:PqqD family protein [Phycisphaerae bacterium]
MPIPRPKYLVPPLSWILPFSPYRRVELEPVGSGVLKMCDGRRTVEAIIEAFAAGHKLSFREAQLAVTQFLSQLMQRGLVVIVGQDGDTRGS